MNRPLFTACFVLVLAAVLVGWTRPWLFDNEQAVKEGSAVYTLPSPPVLERMSLGYRAALADYLWAHLLVTQGLRMGERRPFPEMGDYLDAINHLAPRFREPYRLADSIMPFQMRDPDREATLVRVRGILERGLRTFPLDAELWLNYGQFLAYIGPGSLKDADKRQEWREAGAQALVRAGELGGYRQLMAFRTLSAATALTKQGKRDAAIRFLRRTYALTEDEEVKADILRRLESLQVDKEKSRVVVLSQRLDELWRSTTPFTSRVMVSVLGPPRDTWSCAGPLSGDELERCGFGWEAWGQQVMRERQPP